MEKKLKRDPVKYIRDKMKRKYKSKEPCFICGSETDVELHHLYSVAELWNNWVRKNKITITCDEDVLALRETFEQEHEEQLSNDNLYSLCKTHHLKLHSIYGQSYSNFMAKRVKAWLERQASGE